MNRSGATSADAGAANATVEAISSTVKVKALLIFIVAPGWIVGFYELIDIEFV